MMEKNAVNDAFIGMGTNLGNRQHNLETALSEIRKRAGKVISKSSVFETEPWGYSDQPNFLNAVIKIHTSLTPEELLETLLTIENKLGRTRTFKNAARIIDLDLLFYGDRSVHTERLIVPHPRVPQRNFVLKPLAEIAPNFVHPELEKSVSELLSECQDNLKVAVAGRL